MSSIVVACECGQRFKARAELAGRTLPCPHCKRPITTPLPAPLVATCRCGSKFKAPHTWAGKQVACPNCNQMLTVSQQPAIAVSSNDRLDDFPSPANESPAMLQLGHSNLPNQSPTFGPGWKTIFKLVGIGLAAIVMVAGIVGLYLVAASTGFPDVKLEKISREDGSPAEEINRAFGVYDTSDWVERALPASMGSIRMPAGTFDSHESDRPVWKGTTAIPDSGEVYAIELIKHQSPSGLIALAQRRRVAQASSRYQQSMTYEERADYQGSPGWEFGMEASSATGEVVVFHTRIVATSTHLIMMTRGGRREAVEEDKQAFFNTLRWREPAAP